MELPLRKIDEHLAAAEKMENKSWIYEKLVAAKLLIPIGNFSGDLNRLKSEIFSDLKKIVDGVFKRGIDETKKMIGTLRSALEPIISQI